MELMHECFPEDSRMGTVRMKKDKETEEEDKQKRVTMEMSKVCTKQRSLKAYL